MNSRRLNSLVTLCALLFNLLPANTPPANAGAEASPSGDARQSLASVAAGQARSCPLNLRINVNWDKKRGRLDVWQI